MHAEFEGIFGTTHNITINKHKLDIIIIVGQSSSDREFVSQYKQACIDHHLDYKIIGSGREDDPVMLKDLEGLHPASVVILTGHGGISPLSNQHEFDINHTTTNLSADLIQLIQKQTQADKFLITTCFGGAIANDLLKNNRYKNLISSTEILMTATKKETSLNYNGKELILNLIKKIAENKEEENKYYFVEYVHDNLITVPETLTYLITDKDEIHKKTLRLKSKYLEKIQQKKIAETSPIERYQAYLIKKFNEVINGLTLSPYEEIVLDTDEKNIIQNIIRRDKNASKMTHYKTNLLIYQNWESQYDMQHQAILDEILRQCRGEEFASLMREIDANGFSTLFLLACHEKNRELLTKIDPTYIYEKTLNTIILNGCHKGESALFYLAATSQGRETLARIDPNLINKIALNAVIQEGSYKGISPLLRLAGNEKGREILAQIDPTLINKEALNTVMQEAPNKGESALFWLTGSKKGIEVLAHIDPKLITADALNAVIQEGSNKGQSALYRLAGTVKGLEVLAHIDPKLITADALNAVIQEGPYKGESALFWLAGMEKGREILAHIDPKLITADVLNAVFQEGPYKYLSALFYLAGSEKGREILAQIDPKLINKEALNTVIQEGDKKGISTLYCLTESKDGRELLLKNKQWLALFSKKTLNTIIEAPGEQPGKSAAHWLLHTKEGKQILAYDPNLEFKIQNESTENKKNTYPCFFKDVNKAKKHNFDDQDTNTQQSKLISVF